MAEADFRSSLPLPRRGDLRAGRGGKGGSLPEQLAALTDRVVLGMAASGYSAVGAAYGLCRADEAAAAAPEEFPAGLRVLVVDDDPTCLKTLEMMLWKCNYRVTTCSHATIALQHLRGRKGGYDVVITDVHMPDMNGFSLLELVGLEMDLPVIMMSADGSTDAVMEGIRHGACDYLIKPVRMEELKNIWQHVYRKKKNENRDLEHSGSVEESNHPKRGFDESEFTSSINEVVTDGSLRSQKKRKDCKDTEEDVALDNDDSSSAKKPRVVWSVELHQQFVTAVNQLGIDKAVPKRILELMNVPGLTRENVASHLQKFRLYLKRLSAVTQHQGGMSSPYCGLVETNSKVNSLRSSDFQALAASGQIPPQVLPASVHAEMLGRSAGSVILSGLDRCSFPQTSVPGPNRISVEQGIAFGQPLMKCPSSVHKQLPQCNVVLGGMPSGVGSWSPDLLNKPSTNNLTLQHSIHNGNVLADFLPEEHSQNIPCDSSQSANNIGMQQSLQNCNVLAQMLHQERSQTIPPESTHKASILNMQHNVQNGDMLTQVLPQEPSQIVPQESNHQANVQPSCLITPSQSLNNYSDVKNPAALNSDLIAVPAMLSNRFHLGNNPANPQNPSYLIEENLLPSQSSSLPSCGERAFDGNDNNTGLLDSYPVPNSFSVSPGLMSVECPPGWRLQNSSGSIVGSHVGNLSGVSSSLYAVQNSITNLRTLAETGQLRDFGFAARNVLNGTHVGDIKPPIHEMIQKQIISCDGSSRGKQEFHMDVLDGSKVGGQPVHFSPGDYMRVLSK